MNRNDPYSTPARRRRIIAELARRNLKGFYLAACYNVKLLRIRTRASIIMQCSWRMYYSKKRLCSLKYRKMVRVATRIQSVWRMKLAILLKHRLRKKLQFRQQLRLVRVVDCLWIAYRYRQARNARILAMKLARERLEVLSSVSVQRCFRGFMGRRAFHERMKRRRDHLKRLNTAAAAIQCAVRMRFAVRRLNFLRQYNMSLKLIRRITLSWWHRRQRQRHRCAAVLQSAYRIHRSMRLLDRLKHRKRMSDWLFPQLINEAIDELLHPMAGLSIPFSRSMYVHVDIDKVTLCAMAALGPTFVSNWAIRNNLLRYRRVAGFSPGAIVRQVVDTVNTALNGDATDSRIDGIDGVGDNDIAASDPLTNQVSLAMDDNFDKVIILSKWAEDDDDTSTDGTESRLPICKWTALVGDSRISYSLPPPFTSSWSTIVVERTRSTMELHLITMEDSDDDGADRNCNFYRYTRIIVFNCIARDCNSPLNLLDIKQMSQFGFESSDFTQSKDDLKVMFRNALVYVDHTQGRTASNIVDMNAPIAKDDGDNDDDFIVEDTDSSINNEIDEAVAPAVSTLPEAVSRSRPGTAVIRIILREPTPPPTPPPRSIPYHLMASCIQMAYRRRYRYRGSMAMKIIAFLKRNQILCRWRELVFMMIDLMHYAAVTIQCSVRCFLARIRLLSLQWKAFDRYYRLEYCHDFRQDEAANWKAFGHDISIAMMNDDGASFSIEESLFASSPVLELCDADTIPHSVKRLNPIEELLAIIDFPTPPMDCILPSSSSLLFMSSTYPLSVQGDGRGVVHLHDNSNDKSHSRESIQSRVLHSHLKQRVVRSSIEPEIHSSRGSVGDTGGIVVGDDGCSYRCNSIGDITSTSISAGLVDATGIDIDRFYRESNASFSIPFYTLLANKLK